MCVGQLSLVPYLSFQEEERDHYHFQGVMVGKNMEGLGKLVGKPCCIWCCIMENV
jgi:hypothetical protein